MKRLILCCDGTWNSADQEKNGTLCPTNVVKLAYRIAKRDEAGTYQIIFYDQGVGTGNAVDRFSGGAFGHGLEDNILDAYRFLIGNYEPGDEIYLFGFSRGAFTARSIAGMLRKCGILQRQHIGRYPDARRLYHDGDVHPDGPEATKFRAESSCCGSDPVGIRCIGVWDTVGSLGIPLRGLRGLTRRKYTFHDTELSSTVEYGFHALAIDEHRAPFEPTLWMEKPKAGQTILQTWFSGVHSDVGGGYAESEVSDVPLQWMLDNARAAGLRLDEQLLTQHALAPSTTAKLHESKTGMYRLTVGIDRPIGTGPTQSVHPSVLERWDRDPRYRPKNLREWFRATGDARGGQS